MRRRNVGIDEASVHIRHTGRKSTFDNDVHRVQCPFGGAGQQGQAAAWLGLEALGETFTEHDFRLFAAAGQNLARSNGQERPLHGKLAIRVYASGHHHGGFFAIADQTAEFDARQHLTHLRVRQQLAAQFLCVVQSMLQRRVLVLVELIRLANNQMPCAARRHLRQALVSGQRKAARHQNRRRTECCNRHRDQRAAPVAQRVLPGKFQPHQIHASLPSSSERTRSQRLVSRLSCVAITKAAPSAWPSSRISSST